MMSGISLPEGPLVCPARHPHLTREDLRSGGGMSCLGPLAGCRRATTKVWGVGTTDIQPCSPSRKLCASASPRAPQRTGWPPGTCLSELSPPSGSLSLLTASRLTAQDSNKLARSHWGGGDFLSYHRCFERCKCKVQDKQNNFLKDASAKTEFQDVCLRHTSQALLSLPSTCQASSLSSWT